MKAIKDNTYEQTRILLSRQINYSFAIPDSLLPEFEEYKLIYWSARELYKRLMLNLEEAKNYDYYIDRQDTLYTVHMINCDINSLYDIAINEPDRQIRISFRRARKHWNLDPVAIIKLPASHNKLIDLRDSKGNYNHD